MPLDRADAQMQPHADVRVREALGHQDQDAPLPVGQPLDEARGGRLTPALMQEPVDHRTRHLRRKDHPTICQGTYQVWELLRVGVLEQEPGGARPQGRLDVFIGVEGGEHGDHRRVRKSAQLGQYGEPVHVGHADVQQDDVGPQLSYCADRLAAGDRCDHVDVISSIEDVRKACTDECFVIDHQNPDHARSTRRRTSSDAYHAGGRTSAV